jgi:hypothetical protein
MERKLTSNLVKVARCEQCALQAARETITQLGTVGLKLVSRHLHRRVLHLVVAQEGTHTFDGEAVLEQIGFLVNEPLLVLPIVGAQLL